MPIKVTGITFGNEFRGETTNWLLANVGDKLVITIDIEVETICVASTDNEFTFMPSDGFVNTDHIIDENGNSFEEIKVGDTITISGAGGGVNGNYTVIEKINDGNIRVNTSPGGGTSPSSTAIIQVTTPITAVRYKWNFIENNEPVTWQSKIDGNDQVAVASYKLASDTSTTAMTFLGSKSYQIGSITIEGEGIDVSPYYKSKYRIIHTTYITPFMLTNQWADIVNNIAPDYYFDSACLRAIFDFEAQYNYTDPNNIKTIGITEILGNTGWFNENFNTGLTNYSATTVFKRPDTTVIPAIELVYNSVTKVEIVVNNTTDSPFSNNNTKFVLNFCIAPDDENNYINNGKTVAQNFCFDRALQTVGSAAVNGDNYGGAYQSLTNVSAQFISGTQIKITADIDFASLGNKVIETANENNSKNYMLWVSVQKHSLATTVADKVSLLVSAAEFYEDLSDPTMIVLDTSFLRHPSSDVATEAVSALFLMPEDECVSFTRFYVDKNNRLTDEIILQAITARVKVRNTSTGHEFPLETYTFNASQLPFINGNQYVDYTLNRPFHIPNAEPRKPIRLIRRPDLDNSNKYYYDFYYPWLNRWEYWIALAGVNGDFFDISEPNNGFNNEWHRYSTIGNWKIFYEINVRATKNGSQLVYRKSSQCDSNDYNSNPDWINESIKSFDNATNVELVNGGDKFIQGYTATRIEAKFEGITTPDINDIVVCFGIEAYESGGVLGRRRYSSKWATPSDTWFKSLTGNDKIDLSLSGNIITAKCLIDENALPLQTQRYKITARLYDLSQIILGKIFEDDEDFLFQDDEFYLFEDQ